eukprot:2803132-Prymnesium_polylepis.1
MFDHTDQCHSLTASGTLEESEDGCGLVVARNGLPVTIDSTDNRATLIANGRNPLFVRTHFQDIFNDGTVTHTSLLSLKITTETLQPTELCDNAVIVREHFVDGLEEIAVDGLPDPVEPYNPATLCACHASNPAARAVHVCSWCPTAAGDTPACASAGALPCPAACCEHRTLPQSVKATRLAVAPSPPSPASPAQDARRGRERLLHRTVCAEAGQDTAVPATLDCARAAARA